MKQSKPRRASFLKVAITAVLTAAVGLGMLYIYSVGLFWPSMEVLRYTWLAALGVVGGLFARLILGKHTFALRFLAALFAVITSLWLADWVTGGYVGIQVIDLDHAYPDYPSLIELGVPWLAAVLALRAWKKRRQPAPAAPPVSKPTPPATAPKPAPKPIPAPYPLPASTKVTPVPVDKLNANWRKQIGQTWSALVAKIKEKLPVFNANGFSPSYGQRVASEPMSFGPPTVKSMTVDSSARTIISPRQKRENKARALADQENRCPYCLQEVDLNDPRGVKVCHVCGTYHHADCWDVTGHCQSRNHRPK